MVSKNTTKVFCFFLVGGALLAGCGSSSDEKPDMEITTDSLSDNVRTEMVMIKSSIPSPLELTNEISKTKINYNKSLMNSSSKSGSYSTNFQKAAAMGAYGADLGYAAAYGQSQDIMEYFGSVTKLAKDLGLESAFDENMLGAIKDNLGKKDTLMTLIDKVYRKAENHCRSNQRVSMAAVMAAGGWIEGIYLTSSLIKESPRDTATAGVYDRTWSHVNSFKNVMDLLGEYKSNADCAKMLEMLKDFEPFVNKTHKRGGGVLTQEDVKAINEKIGEIRGKVLN